MNQSSLGGTGELIDWLIVYVETVVWAAATAAVYVRLRSFKKGEGASEPDIGIGGSFTSGLRVGRLIILISVGTLLIGLTLGLNRVAGCTLELVEDAQSDPVSSQLGPNDLNPPQSVVSGAEFLGCGEVYAMDLRNAIAVIERLERAGLIEDVTYGEPAGVTCIVSDAGSPPTCTSLAELFAEPSKINELPPPRIATAVIMYKESGVVTTSKDICRGTYTTDGEHLADDGTAVVKWRNVGGTMMRSIGVPNNIDL